MVLRRTDSVLQFLNQVVFFTNTTAIEKFWYMYFGPPTVQNTCHSGRGGQNFSMALVLVQRPRLSLHARHARNGGRKYWNFQKCFNLVNWFQKVFEIAQLRANVQWLKKYSRRKVKVILLTIFVTKITTFRGVIHTVLDVPGPLACIYTVFRLRWFFRMIFTNKDWGNPK